MPRIQVNDDGISLATHPLDANAVGAGSVGTTPVIPEPDPTHTPPVPEPDPTHTPPVPGPDPTPQPSPEPDPIPPVPEPAPQMVQTRAPRKSWAHASA